MRGNRRQHLGARRDLGSIPACAGEPCPPCATVGAVKVYPRVCGGTNPLPDRKAGQDGLSPRVRGNPGPECPDCPIPRSIPACAGEPPAPPLRAVCRRVYPRVCGGTPRAASSRSIRWGLSPRVRGNRWARPLRTMCEWSIPACAGEPLATGLMPQPARVYPRVCGGTAGPGACRRA